MSTRHLFVDISSHGLGHLAQAAPILNALARHVSGLQLTVQSGLPGERLRARVDVDAFGAFRHLARATDFGYVMHDAMRVDREATAAAYRAQHADWERRVDTEAEALRALRPDLVLTDVAYLPLAAAARAGIPALSMCSLNWADLFAHYFGQQPWAAAIHRQMLAAYRSAASFLRLTPAMPMDDFARTQAIAPVAGRGRDRRGEILALIGAEPDDKLALVAFGGFDKALGAEHWPPTPGWRWLVPQSWPEARPVSRPDMIATEPLIEASAATFTDLLASVDVVLTKPGYGTFTEAAGNGAAVLYLPRDDWPEQRCLIDWLQANARCAEIAERDLLAGDLAQRLRALLNQALPPVPATDGAEQAAAAIARLLA